MREWKGWRALLKGVGGMEREEEEGVGQELGYFPANSSLSRVTYGSGEFNTGA